MLVVSFYYEMILSPSGVLVTGARRDMPPCVQFFEKLLKLPALIIKILRLRVYIPSE